MLIARLIFGLLLVAGVLCFAMYAGTGQARWRSLGWRIVKWTLVAALGFFAVLILERLALAL
jgi:disulfide bond formation protein DsbB